MKKIDLKKALILLFVLSTTMIISAQNKDKKDKEKDTTGAVINYRLPIEPPPDDGGGNTYPWNRDADNDGYGDPLYQVEYATKPAGYVANNSDCNDGNPNIHPGATEILDGLDNDCDGLVDEGIAPPTPTILSITQYCGYTKITRATPPSGYTWYWQSSASGTSISNSTSFIDLTSGSVYYLRSKNNSTLFWSTSLTINYTIIQPPMWYSDIDGDGFGDINSSISQCTQPIGYVSNNLDTCPSNYSTSNNGCPNISAFSDENYIYTITPQIPVTDISGLTENKHAIKNITYFDGLGRPVQSIGIKQSGITGKDIITHIDYDAFGRQAKDYLPYVPSITGNDGSYRTDALSATNSFYDATNYDADFPGMTTSTINPYSEKKFEPSPLNRVLEQTAPGSSWKAGIIFDTNGHTDGNTIKFGNQTNIISEVRLYNVTLAFANNTYTPTLQNTTPYYAASQLYKTIIKDENWKTLDGLNKTTEEFKDKQGKVILKRAYVDVNSVSTAHDTYYVYDDYGNLTYVLPPKMEASTATIATVNSQLNELGYQYKYDNRNRLVEKKIPGKGLEYIVYNKLDQPVLTQDAVQRADRKWLFTKYDVFGRGAYTGIYTHASAITQSEMQLLVNSHTGGLFESREISSANNYYSNDAYPISGTEVLTINYYDDYNFGVPANPVNRTYTDPITTRTKGLATGSKVKVLGQTNIWITTTSYYDDKARPIYAKSINEYLGTTDIVESKLDFVGKVEKTKTTHNKTGQTQIIIITEDTFVYDHVGRLKSQTQTINGVNPETIVANTYDELGQLTTKGVGGKTSRLQTVNYAYNIRGWLKQINDPNILGTDLFGFKINYNTASHGATALYNGNISETEWKTQNDNVLRWYNYGYDALNRITKGISSDGKFDLGATTNPVTYDQNGNILSLYRKGAIVANPVIATPANYGVMDNLTYTYQNSSNKLLKVSDAIVTPSTVKGEFKDDYNYTTPDPTDDYTYDANGNMLTDANKGITAITYNHLNLPTKVTFAADKYISYFYDATGVKLRKIVSTGPTTDYAGNYVYENSTLQFFNTAEGYVEPVNASDYNLGFNYVYQYKDHLGNIRLSYSDKNKNGVILVSTDPLLTEIVEENNYYPFGLKHKGYNNVITSTNIAQKYKTYQGQELTDELNYNMLEFKYRHYDPAIARFVTVDPLAEKYAYQSPYNFSENQVVAYRELEGLEKIHFQYVFTKDQISVSKTAINGPLGNGVLVSSNHGGKTTHYYGNTISSSLTAFKKAYEGTNLDGKSNHVGYNDHLGNPTIGYGHKIVDGDDYSVGSKITENMAQELFNSDSKWIMDSADEYLEDYELNQSQTNALYDAAFNMGPGKMSQYTEVGSKFSKGNFFLKFMAGGEGIKKRRYAENILYNEGISVSLDVLKGKSIEQIMNYLNSIIKSDEKKK